MTNTLKAQGTSDDNVIPLFHPPSEADVPALTPEEILKLRTFMREFAIIRATCPLAIRALSDI